MNDGPALIRYVLMWGVPFAIVVAALGYETDWGHDVDHEAPVRVAAAPQPVAVSLLPEYRIGDGVEARKETVDRVLFNPTRRAAPPATQTGESASSMKRGLYTLTGTTVVGNVATAFLREVNGGKSHTVHPGETLNGVVVAEVKSDHVRLKQGDDVEDLSLKLAAGPRSTVQRNVAAEAGRVSAQAASAAPTVAPVARPGASVAELLANRRRAARAAAANGSNSGGNQQPVAPGTAAPTVPVPAPQTQSTAQPSTTSAATGWDQVYQRMQRHR